MIALRAAPRPLPGVHGSRPETARGVALAVVHAIARAVGLRIDERRLPIPLEVEQGESVHEARHESTASARNETADGAGHGPRALLTGRWGVATDGGRQDVDPVERRLLGDPHRPLSEGGVGLPDTRGLEHGQAHPPSTR